jgi:Predicted membrane protein
VSYACHASQTLAYPFRPHGKTATDQTTERSLKTKPNTIQPPPLTGIYKVPGSGSLVAWKPEKNIRQATAIAVATGGFALLAAVLGDTALDIAVSRGVSPSLFETHEGLGSLAAILFGVWAVIRAFFWWKKIPLEGGRKALVVLVDILLVLLIVLVAYYGGQLVYEHGVNVMPKAG